LKLPFFFHWYKLKSDSPNLRSSLFWVVTHHWLIVAYQCSGTGLHIVI
jgi:hypothetical protein